MTFYPRFGGLLGGDFFSGYQLTGFKNSPTVSLALNSPRKPKT
jgi:hypothetical protein